MGSRSRAIFAYALVALSFGLILVAGPLDEVAAVACGIGAVVFYVGVVVWRRYARRRTNQR